MDTDGHRFCGPNSGLASLCSVGSKPPSLSVIMKTIRAVIIVLTSAALVSCDRGAKPDREAGVPAEVLEKRECQRNLEKIYVAIKAYQKAHEQLPNWLSDLVPGALSNTNVLICPVARREGVKTYPGLEDPRLATSLHVRFLQSRGSRHRLGWFHHDHAGLEEPPTHHLWR